MTMQPVTMWAILSKDALRCEDLFNTEEEASSYAEYFNSHEIFKRGPFTIQKVEVRPVNE